MAEGQVAEQPSIEQRFQALLQPEPEKKPPVEHQEAEPENPEAAPEETEEAEPEGAASEVEIDPDAPFLDVQVKVEGGSEKVEKLSLNQLKSGYMMQADYQRKTAEVARQREAIPLEVQKQIDPVVQRYEHNLNIFQTAVTKLAHAELQNVDWNKLAEEDPAQFVKLQARATQFNQILGSAQSELQKVQQERQEKSKAEIAKATASAIEVLQKDIPGWGNELYSSVLTSGVEKYGFRPEEVGNVTDPRMIKVLHDAFQYQKLVQAKPAVEKRVAAVPKVLKPGSAERSEEPNKREVEARKTLRASGGKDMKAAAALFQSRMNRGKK